MSALSAAGRSALGLGATAILMLGIAAASSAPIALHPGGSGRLRLSWSARPERIETCRQVSDKELAELEEHMRQRVECEGRFATYLLEVRADGRRVAAMTVRGAGLRHDRPIYLLREFPIPAGDRRIRVTFTRREQPSQQAEVGEESEPADTGISAGRAEREGVERARRGRAAIPPRLALDTSLTIAARSVVVVTLNQERRSLEVVQEPRGR